MYEVLCMFVLNSVTYGTPRHHPRYTFRTAQGVYDVHPLVLKGLY